MCMYMYIYAFVCIYTILLLLFGFRIESEQTLKTVNDNYLAKKKERKNLIKNI